MTPGAADAQLSGSLTRGRSAADPCCLAAKRGRQRRFDNSNARAFSERRRVRLGFTLTYTGGSFAPAGTAVNSYNLI